MVMFELAIDAGMSNDLSASTFLFFTAARASLRAREGVDRKISKPTLIASSQFRTDWRSMKVLRVGSQNSRQTVRPTADGQGGSRLE
jgi:hypothetical protein